MKSKFIPMPRGTRPSTVVTAVRITGRNRVFPANTTARARADAEILIQTGNAGGFTFLLNGQPARPLGRAGQFIDEFKITPANYKDLLEVRPPGPPAG